MPKHHLEVATVITSLVKLLVDRPLDVSIDAVESQDDTTLRCTVYPADLGKVIGKQGKTARSLRVILHSISKTAGHRYLLDISPRKFQEGNG